MNYPPYHLSKRSRTVIFAFFSLAFLIIAPSIALYTAGYRFDMHTKNFNRIGVLSIDTLPKDATVYLNNTVVAQHLPLRLTNMTPGTYNLRIEKEGYLSWSKDIVIEEHKTTYIKDFSLFFKSSPEAIETNETLLDIFPSSNGNYLIEKFQTSTQTQMTLFATAEERATEIIRDRTGADVSVNWSERSNTAAIIKTAASSTEIMVLKGENPTQISRLPLEGAVTGLNWRENFYRDQLFIRFENSLYTMDANEISKPETLRTTSTLFYRENEGNDWYFDFETKTLTNIQNSNRNIYVGSNLVREVVDINSTRVILQTNDGLLVIQRDDIQEIKTVPTPNFFYDAVRKEYISWSPWEVWTIYQNGEVALLNRMSEAIQQVLALDDTGALLVITSNKLLGFNPGYYVTQEIHGDIMVQKATVDKRTKTIYFLGTWQEKKGLYKLKY